MLEVNADVLSLSVSAVACINYSYYDVLRPHPYLPFKTSGTARKGNTSFSISIDLIR